MATYDFSAPRLYVEPDLGGGASLPLDKPQQNYLCNVLRLKQGEAVLVFNGRHGEWRARLVVGAGRKTMALALDAQVRAQTAAPDLHYLFAPLKHARLDYMAQKAVEMGAGVLRPVITRRCQVARVNVDRLAANAVEAAEQCGILSLPRVEAPISLETALSGWDDARALVFCDEDAEAQDAAAALRALPSGTPLAVLVGPEGGFDPAEREALLAVPRVVRLSLGPRILRADTAAVAALALVQALAGDWLQAHHDLARL